MSALPAQQILYKGQQKGLGLGVFNDNIRNGLIGSVFDHSAQGFAMGAPFRVDTIKRGVQGSIYDFTAAPSETINYVTSHDNLTLWDKIADCDLRASEMDRIKMDMLAQAVILDLTGRIFYAGWRRVPYAQKMATIIATKLAMQSISSTGDAKPPINMYSTTMPR